MTRANLPAVILAGGRATRMGGGDKALLPLCGRPILDHILKRLAPDCTTLAINANGPAAGFAPFGLPVLPDSIPGFPGPLAGILAAMDWAAVAGHGAVITVAGDCPFFPATLVADLIANAGPKGIGLAALRDATGGLRVQPTFGLWPVSLREGLRADLHRGQRKVRVWADAQGAVLVPFDDDGAAFFNINTAQDLAQAETILATLLQQAR